MNKEMTTFKLWQQAMKDAEEAVQISESVNELREVIKASDMQKTYPRGTTKEQWDRYEKELAAYKEQRETIKPRREDFPTEDDYSKALSKWSFEYTVDAPNKPGYYKANND